MTRVDGVGDGDLHRGISRCNVQCRISGRTNAVCSLSWRKARVPSTLKALLACRAGEDVGETEMGKSSYSGSLLLAVGQHVKSSTLAGRGVGIRVVCCVDINSSRNLAPLWSRASAELCKKHELRNCAPCHGQGFLQENPTSPLHPRIPPCHTAATPPSLPANPEGSWGF